MDATYIFMDIKILIATHKSSGMPDDPVYLPLHVGAEGEGGVRVYQRQYEATIYLPKIKTSVD